MGQGTSRFLLGTAVGAVGGFALGAFVVTPAARSAGELAVGGLGHSARFVGKSAARAAHGLESIAEAGYTRVRGREKYLEHEIEELREQITRLEQRID